jgi:hypothetical protein
MRQTIARAGCLALLLGLFATSAAHAQGTSLEEARHAFEQGHAAYEAGRFA